MRHFFDLHLHPSAKPFLQSACSSTGHNCWEYIGSVTEADRSQSCLDQLKAGGVNLAVAALYPLEKPFLSGQLTERSLPRRLPPHRNYLDLVRREIQYLERSSSLDPANGRSFRFLRDIGDYHPDQLNLILALDGGHCLIGSNGSSIKNLHRLKAQSGHRFLYMTLVQKTRTPLATHAYSLPQFNELYHFRPLGFGLSSLGKKAIDLAYDDANGQRTLVDIRHLSLVSRFQFYQYRRQQGYRDIPILASHTGVTGISWRHDSLRKYILKQRIIDSHNVAVKYRQPPGIGSGSLSQTNFNPWSANLYREDILEVLESGGLIGLSMDQHALGTQGACGEFFSCRDFNFIMSGFADHNHRKQAASEVGLPDPGKRKDVNEIRHLRHLCNNILYIVRVGGTGAWKQMCLGSDFDGLMSPINFCTDASEYPKLEEGLIDMLPQMMAEDNSHQYDESDLEQKVRGIMYDNALYFLRQHFR